MIERHKKLSDKYIDLIDNLDEALYRMPDGKYEFFSSGIKKVFGYPEEECLNNPIFIKK